VNPSVRQELVKHTDITATIYDWARVDPPLLPVGSPSATTAVPMLHGRSLLPLLQASGVAADPWRDEILIQSNNSHTTVSPTSWARTLRTERYRYTHFFGDGGEQLFDLSADPDEQVSLAQVPEYRETVDRLRARLLEAAVRDAYPNSPHALYRLGTW
jgi:choline-sulfatase